MRTPAILIGLFILVLGVLGAIVPASLVGLSRLMATETGLYVSGLVRVAFGLVLIAAAPPSRHPLALTTLGVVAFIAGLVTPAIGVERAQRLVEGWVAQGPLVVRATCLGAAAIGTFVVFAAIDGHGAAARRARRASRRELRTA